MDKENPAKFRQVTEAAFNAFVKKYPTTLDIDIADMCEPPLKTYNDFSKGKPWPDSIVAKVKLYDGSAYHGGKLPEYYILNKQ